jgi:hypothetical protein
MISIPIAVCGDDWTNRDTVIQQLNNSNLQDPVVLDLHAEGPSLHALGIVDVVLKHMQRAGQPADQVYVENWSNSVESVPFQRLNRHQLSHFFWFSDQYRSAVPSQRTAQRLFGYFVGRRTVPRCVMLKEIHEKYADQFLLSLMNTVAGFRFSDQDPLQQWTAADEFHRWYCSQPVASLDHHTVRDQFSGDHNTNASLLRWYPSFDIELVAETYCHGDTFFVTEKTVRPIIAGKNMMIYGPRNYLARLRDLGFQTWNHIWDESYDQLAGLDRWHAMRLVIDDLIKRDQQQLYRHCQQIVQHNQQHADTLIDRHRPR